MTGTLYLGRMMNKKHYHIQNITVPDINYKGVDFQRLLFHFIVKNTINTLQKPSADTDAPEPFHPYTAPI